jgi:hypothetical protein
VKAGGRKFERRDGNFELYQIGTEAAEGQTDVIEGEFASDGVTAEAEGGHESCAAAEERVEDQVAFV